jgi:hypothetical protein
MNDAVFSQDRKYRYTLTREWPYGEGTLCVCALNPSSADEIKNDATVERCIYRAKSWGYRRFVMVNLFAWRSTDPTVLATVPDPVGPENDAHILAQAKESNLFIAGWGSRSPLVPDRSKAVTSMLNNAGVKMHALIVSAVTGEPGHPLYLSYSRRPFPLEGLR